MIKDLLLKMNNNVTNQAGGLTMGPWMKEWFDFALTHANMTDFKTDHISQHEAVAAVWKPLHGFRAFILHMFKQG